ncbi:hypothetical protein D3C85_1909510 [compost metagenome]
MLLLGARRTQKKAIAPGIPYKLQTLKNVFGQFPQYRIRCCDEQRFMEPLVCNPQGVGDVQRVPT